MEDIYKNQVELHVAMSKIVTNIKKDSKDRKSADYFKRRLETLEAYWADYQYNHDRLSSVGSRAHQYFTNNEYAQVSDIYKTTRLFIREQQQAIKEGNLEELTTNPQPQEFQQGEVSLESEQAGQASDNEGGHQSSATRQLSRGSSSKLDDMLKRQSSNFRAFVRTVSGIDLNLATQKWELEDALRVLQARWSIIDTLHWELDSELEGMDVAYERCYTNHERTYNELKKEINCKLWSVSHKENWTPKMEIPNFSGNYQNWVSFKDLFTEAIHSNISISNAQKMQFLKGKLRGEAERLIQHLPISTENYSIAWGILNNRYNNLRLIFSTHANTLLNLPATQQVSVNHIKKIHDTTQECLNAIKNLGVNTSGWDPLIVHILLQKLDTETHNGYLESLKSPRDLPNLQDFLKFLENRFTTLESSRRKPDNIKQSNTPQKYVSNLKPFKSNHYNTKQLVPAFKEGQSTYNNNNSAKLSCPLCKEMHGIYFCNKFLNMTPEDKRKTLTRLRLCHNCLYCHNNKACFSEKRCRECNGNHNTLVHEAFQNSAVNITIAAKDQALNENPVVQQGTNMNEILLATAVIKVQAGNGTFHKMRALIDQGSQVSLITENALQILALPRKPCKGSISGVGAKESSCKGVTEIMCNSLYGSFSFKTEAYIMNTLIKNLPSYTFNKPTWSYLDGIQLSDPDFNVSRPVDILLGADVYANIILDGISRSDQANLPIAQQTRLGWILCGKTQTWQCNVVLTPIDEIRKFWEIEDISAGQSLSMSEEDTKCVKYYKATTTRREDGSYEVRIPFQENFEAKLGTSKHAAIAQFHQLERKFRNNANIEQQYKLFVNEYKQLGHMKLSSGNQTPNYYMPHHCVMRNESSTTALRVVFNASTKTNLGCSLNDLMLKGPNLQQDIQSLLLKWRQHRYAFTADIEKMFRFIWVNEQDQRFQKIIWRDFNASIWNEYQLCTVTYGTKAAPFLAMMTLKQLAEDERQNYHDSQAIQVLENSFYMDDVLHGADTVESAATLQQDLIKLLKSGGFNLRKWKSNAQELVKHRSELNQGEENFEFKQPESTKTLGLRWDPKEDIFTFQSQIEPTKKTPTKRSMLSDISKLYDPLGWLSPVSTRLKLLFQKVWNTNTQWDDKLPEDTLKEWIKIREDIKHINSIKLARWLFTSKQRNQIELHGFCDSSNKAYACVIYCKIRFNDDVKVSLVAGKSRLVPASKSVSLPRLELSGALLLATLMEKVHRCLHNYNIEMYGWVDSMVVLAWLQGNPGRWKPFVANRVRRVTEIIPSNQWRYVKSGENPADCASRGMSVDQLKEHSLWWKGPSWLPEYSRKQTEIFKTDEEVKKSKQVNYVIKTSTILDELLARFSSYQKLTRVLAWILRFINSTKQKKIQKSSYLTLKEIYRAKYTIIKYVQQLEFTNEINNLQQNEPLSAKSKLLQFNPFFDSEGLLRVGGRLNKADINPDMRNPILLPHSGLLTSLVIDHAHILSLHGGARVTLAIIRRKYWVIGGNRAVKSRLRNCVTCRKHNPTKMTQLMGDLPTYRCNIAKPFYNTGVDFTGHMFIKLNKGRGIKTTKGYVAVFICMVTKIVHLELVSDLSSSAFLAALRRMAARKGSPRNIYCDNGTNFVGASNIMTQEFANIIETFDQDFINEITNMEIEWHFNAPSWPSAGGLWEAAVKSVKFHLRRVIGEQRLTFEEFSTILAQIEAVLNSRPLCPLTEDADDLQFLTPASFININQDMNIMETETDMRTRWYLTQKIVHDIWKRWRVEYLSHLSARSKWRNQKPNIQIDDIVTINDANLPPGKWAVGRVVELHPGDDGQVRVVTLKTKSGFIKRPIIKLSVLPVNNTRAEQDAASSCTSNIKTTKRQVKRSGCNFLSFVTLLLFFMNIFSTGQCLFNTSLLKDDQGLYFDKISDMRLIQDEWKIITYYNMDTYWQGIKACNNYISYLDQMCNQIKNTSHCDIIIIQLQQEYAELEYYNQLLLSQHSGTRRDHRKRRGLIDGVGYLANSLFGVLDERFAEQYKQDILSIHDNQNYLAALVKNQTSIVESEYNVMKRSEDSLNKQHKMLNYLMQQFESFQNVLKKEQDRNLMSNDLTLGAIGASNMLRQLSNVQSTLLDTLTDIYQGNLNFHLISPEQLKETLNSISSHLTKDVTLPVNNLQYGFRNIYSLLKIKARMSKDYLLFELRLPLVSRDPYEITRILPIPHAIGITVMARVVPIADYVAINLRNEKYLTMSEQEVNSCKRDGGSSYLYCYSKGPIYYLKNYENLCRIEQTTRKCQVNYSTCINEWTEMSKPNTYVYFCCEVCPVRILCEDHAAVKHLKGAGILNIDQGCLIKTENFTIYAHNEHSSNLLVKNNLHMNEISPTINRVINISIPTPLLLNYTFSNETQLEKIKKQIDELKSAENLYQQISYHDVHHYIAVYVIIGIILAIGAIMLARKARSEQWTLCQRVVARVEQASPEPTVAFQSTSLDSSGQRLKQAVFSDQCDHESVNEVRGESVYSVPQVHKVSKYTTPMRRKTNFT